MDTVYTKLALTKKIKIIFVGQGPRRPVRIDRQAESGPRAGGCPHLIYNIVRKDSVTIDYSVPMYNKD